VGPDWSHADPRKVRSGEDFDIIIGFLGFWAVLLVVVTVVLEVTGQPALLPAMILLVLVLAIWGMLRLRRSLPPRTARRRH
jgi:H+/Cl- antiporter ClcA